MNVTIREIARLSGVGISTVSRVLNNSGFVSEETRRKVMAVVRENNYVPNSNARNLKATRSKTVALLVKGITNPFFFRMIRDIEKEIALRGYSLSMQNVPPYVDELDLAMREAQRQNLCGVIIMGGSFAYTNEKFLRLGIPCVLLTISAGEGVDPELYSSVIIDDEAEAVGVVDYLASLGHRRIGFIYETPMRGLVTPNDRRYAGYCKGLEKNGISLDPNLVGMEHSADVSGFIIGFRMMRHLLAQNGDITAVFAFADTMAIGAVKAIFSAGRSVPEDISVMGFDGIEDTEFYNPSLDTVQQPAAQMALSAVEILFDMMNGGRARHEVYACQMLKRGSCRSVVRQGKTGNAQPGNPVRVRAEEK